jgi:hypothetical protein
MLWEIVSLSTPGSPSVMAATIPAMPGQSQAKITRLSTSLFNALHDNIEGRTTSKTFPDNSQISYVYEPKYQPTRDDDRRQK